MPDDLEALLSGSSDAGSDSAPKGGGGLRAQLEAVLAERQALKDQLAVLQSESRSRAVRDLAAKHSIPDLALDFFPKDAELTDESASAFVEKYGQLWGATSATAQVPPDQQAAATAAQQFASQANPPALAPLSEDEYRAKFNEASNRDEFLRMLAEMEQTAVHVAAADGF